MKHLLLFICFALAPSMVAAQTYIVDMDSMGSLKLEAGMAYEVGTANGVRILLLERIKGDTFYFENNVLHYQEITAFRNPKRKAILDVLAYPATIGSCVAMSAFPLVYMKGYFLSDTNVMISSLAVFLVESIIFAASRGYLKKNKKWVNLSSLPRLKCTEWR